MESDADPTESTALLATDKPRRSFFPPLRRVFFTSFLLSLTFAETQTSLIYAFRVMTCDEYYKTHAWGGPADADRCALRSIESSTASSIALMSSVTTTCTIVNLFVTGYWIKRFGVKAAMFQQTAWAAMRNLTQILALHVGGATGMRIIQSTQIFNIMGSGGGYQLAANAYIAVLAKPEDRTALFGVLNGIMMLGSSVGYTFGGMLDYFLGRLASFQAAFTLLVFCTIFGSLFLPYIDPRAANTESMAKAPKKTSFLAPLKLFIPRKKEVDGRLKRDYNLLLMGAGAFLSVLATGYVPIALQLVGTNTFGFMPAESGMMLSLTLLVKAFFLSICFPRIIKHGRRWMSSASMPEVTVSSCTPSLSGQEHLDDPAQAPPATPLIANEEPHQKLPSPTDRPHGSAFDLLFLQSSILLDGFVTAAVSLASRGWHIYLAAVALPFASGTGSACKGVVLDFVEPEDRSDALSGIALIERLATVSTIGIFGFFFALLSEIGKPTLIFAADGGIAFVAFFFLLFVRLPKEGAVALPA
ncbi:hypothetical protein P7C73_g3162, partial [Tremellales sp. Uapishka_1]